MEYSAVGGRGPLQEDDRIIIAAVKYCSEFYFNIKLHSNIVENFSSILLVSNIIENFATILKCCQILLRILCFNIAAVKYC